MANHIAKPTQLYDEYEDMLTDLVPLIEPYLPEPIRLAALALLGPFGVKLADYAQIDQLIGAVRRNGLPNSRDHRVYQLIVDHAQTRGRSRGDDPQAA